MTAPIALSSLFPVSTTVAVCAASATVAACKRISAGFASLKEGIRFSGVGHAVAGASVVEEPKESFEAVLDKSEVSVGAKVLPESGDLVPTGPETNELDLIFGCSLLIVGGVNSPAADVQIANGENCIGFFLKGESRVWVSMVTLLAWTLVIGKDSFFMSEPNIADAVGVLAFGLNGKDVEAILGASIGCGPSMFPTFGV